MLARHIRLHLVSGVEEAWVGNAKSRVKPSFNLARTSTSAQLSSSSR